jgi:hypothetical protein
VARFSQRTNHVHPDDAQTMKRRKQTGPPAGHAPKGRHLSTKRSGADAIVPVLTQQGAHAEVKDKALAASKSRRNGRMKSKQPPPSEEMKDVTEIGGLRWKLGRTK